MVEKFQKILEKIIKENDKVLFFGFFKMDEFTDKWSVVFCADWLNEKNNDKFFKFLINEMKKDLSEEESKSIARIGIFSKDEHLIDLLLKFKTGSRIQNQKVNGNVIHDGYIIVSNQDSQ